jgi:hypothetical protein
MDNFDNNLFIRVPPDSVTVFPGDCAVCKRDTKIQGQLDRRQYHGDEGDEVVVLECGHPLHDRCVRDLTHSALIRGQELLCPTCRSLFSEHVLPPPLDANRLLPFLLGVTQAYERGEDSVPGMVRYVTLLSLTVMSFAGNLVAIPILFSTSRTLCQATQRFAINLVGRQPTVTAEVSEAAWPSLESLCLIVSIARILEIATDLDMVSPRHLRDVVFLGYDAMRKSAGFSSIGIANLLSSICLVGHDALYSYDASIATFAVIYIAQRDFLSRVRPACVNRVVFNAIAAGLAGLTTPATMAMVKKTAREIDPAWGITVVTCASIYMSLYLSLTLGSARRFVLLRRPGMPELTHIVFEGAIDRMGQRFGTGRGIRRIAGSAFAIREVLHQISYRVTRALRRRDGGNHQD